LEEMETGLLHTMREALNVYGSTGDPWSECVTPVLKDIPASWLAQRTGLSRPTIQRARNEHARPHPHNLAKLSKAAGEWARAWLNSRGLPTPRDDVAACRAYFARRQLKQRRATQLKGGDGRGLAVRADGAS
jgi:hypothetical protein